jgi:hypothetical protein
MGNAATHIKYCVQVTGGDWLTTLDLSLPYQRTILSNTCFCEGGRFKISSFLALISKHVSGMMEPREACIRSMLLSGIPLAVT